MHVIYENETVTIESPGRDCDFIAVVENKTDAAITITFCGAEPLKPISVAPNDWVGIGANDEGQRIIAATMS